MRKILVFFSLMAIVAIASAFMFVPTSEDVKDVDQTEFAIATDFVTAPVEVVTTDVTMNVRAYCIVDYAAECSLCGWDNEFDHTYMTAYDWIYHTSNPPFSTWQCQMCGTPISPGDCYEWETEFL